MARAFNVVIEETIELCLEGEGEEKASSEFGGSP